MKRSKQPFDLSPEDLAWTEERAIALMHGGLSLVDAIKTAAQECSLRIVDRDIRAAAVLQQEVHDRYVAREKKRAAEQEVARSDMTAKGQAQRPTLKVTLGDMLRLRPTLTKMEDGK